MEKVKVTLAETCLFESTLIVEGDFPEDGQERWNAISELADEGFDKGKGTEPIVIKNWVDMWWD